MFRILSVVSIILISAGCITYDRFPEARINKPPTSLEVDALLKYSIVNNSYVEILGGGQALERALRNDSRFRVVQKVESLQIPEQGHFIRVTIEPVPPSTGAIAFGYMSMATLTIIPVWSTEGGYEIRFDYYYNAQIQKSKDYLINRRGFIWLPMLPFIWVNSFTYSEKDAFQATFYQAIDDMRPYIDKN